jgi:hypothetical protein
MQKSDLQIDNSTDSPDKEKIIQQDSNQLVNGLYLCCELIMITANVRHLYSDRQVF